MRSSVFVLSLLSCSAAFAQGAPAEPPECDTPLPPPPVPPGAADQPFFGNIFLAAPPSISGVPRNAEIRLGGSVSEVAAGFWTVDVSDAEGNELAGSVEGDRVLLDDGLLPGNSTITVVITPTETNPCPGCFGPQVFNFTTNDVVDTVAPVVDGSTVSVNGYVLPSLLEQQACGFFNGDNHTIEVQLGAPEPTFFTVGGRSARTDPVLMLRESLFSGFGAQTLSLSLGRDVALALGEPVVVVVTARDLAGNVSTPMTLRMRMRSFRDRGAANFEPFTCTLEPSPAVTVPSRLPSNPAVRVVFPFEELPLALRPVAGGDDVPLVPVADVAEDARVGHVFQTARAVAPGDYDVTALPCLSCLCAGCTGAIQQRITLADVVDDEAPAAPEVRAIIDDPSPALSQGACRPDGAATVVVLAPGDDDLSGPADLLYDAVVRKEGGLPRPAGTGLPAFLRGNGDVAVRVPAGELGRLSGSNFTLTLTARDAGGNLAQSSYDNVVDVEERGCGGGAAPAASLGALALLLRRRSPRARRSLR